jgi:hypothetical protein
MLDLVVFIFCVLLIKTTSFCLFVKIIIFHLTKAFLALVKNKQTRIINITKALFIKTFLYFIARNQHKKYEVLGSFKICLTLLELNSNLVD